jgi:hypothetical protein
MSDSLTRLILRAQGKLTAPFAVAEPRLASLHETDAAANGLAALEWAAEGTVAEDERPEHPATRPSEASPLERAPARDAYETGRPSFGPSATAVRGGRVGGAAAAGASAPVQPPSIAVADRPVERPDNEVAETRVLGNLPAATAPGDAPPVKAAPQSRDAPRVFAPLAAGSRSDNRPAPRQAPLAAVNAVRTQQASRATPGAAASASSRTERAALARPARSSDAPDAAPTVRITIGTVEVHAVPPRAPPPRPSVPRRPETSLADYLARRGGRSR